MILDGFWGVRAHKHSDRPWQGRRPGARLGCQKKENFDFHQMMAKCKTWREMMFWHMVSAFWVLWTSGEACMGVAGVGVNLRLPAAVGSLEYIPPPIKLRILIVSQNLRSFCTGGDFCALGSPELRQKTSDFFLHRLAKVPGP